MNYKWLNRLNMGRAWIFSAAALVTAVVWITSR
jgi:hypothetical protein